MEATQMYVRVGSNYRYTAGHFMDRIDPRLNEYLKEGDLVKVINVPGCPPANTMGHCYVRLVGDSSKAFVMISTSSLENA
jgi:hypothetical protein